MTRRMAVSFFIAMLMTGGAAFATNRGAQPASGEAEDTQYWQVTANPNLKGPTGRIVVEVPAQASMIFHVLDANNKQLVAWYEPSAGNFMPGSYTVRLWDAIFEGVPVKRHMDTRIKVGVLKLNIQEPYKILDAKGAPIFTGHPSDKPSIVLPVGDYTIETSTLKEKIAIEDRKVTEF